MDDFLEESARIEFAPRYIFYAGGGDAFDYEKSAALIPKDLRAKLDAALPGFSLAKRDGSERLFGRPHYWQGEDEAFDDDDEPEGAPAPGESVMLFQTEFGEGNVHLWARRAAAAKRDYSKC